MPASLRSHHPEVIKQQEHVVRVPAFQRGIFIASEATGVRMEERERRNVKRRKERLLYNKWCLIKTYLYSMRTLF